MKLRTVLCVLAIAGLSTACAQKEKKELKTEAKTADVKLEKKTTTSDLSYACKVGKDIRKVETEATTKRCEIHYTKFGEKSQVAWAEATPKICSRVRDQIRKNIEAKGFKCDADVAKLTTQERKTASK